MEETEGTQDTTEGTKALKAAGRGRTRLRKRGSGGFLQRGRHYRWPLNNIRVGASTPAELKICVHFWLPQSLTINSLLSARRLTHNSQMNTYFVCWMDYILHSYSKANWRKENVTKTSQGREDTFIILYCIYQGKKSTEVDRRHSNLCCSRVHRNVGKEVVADQGEPRL